MSDLHLKGIVSVNAGALFQDEPSPVFVGELLTGVETTFESDLLNFQINAGILPHNIIETSLRTSGCLPSQMVHTCEPDENKNLVYQPFVVLSWQPGFADSRLHVGPTAGGLWSQGKGQLIGGLMGDVGLTRPKPQGGSVVSLSAQILGGFGEKKLFTAGGVTFRFSRDISKTAVISHTVPDEERVEVVQAEPEREPPPAEVAILPEYKSEEEQPQVVVAQPPEELEAPELSTKPVGAGPLLVESEQPVVFGSLEAADIPPAPVPKTSDPVRMVRRELDREIAENAGVLGALGSGGEIPGVFGVKELSDNIVGGIGGLISAKGKQYGKGGLGGPGSGLGGGGTAEGLGGISARPKMEPLAPSTLPQFSYDPSRYKGAAPKGSSRESLIDPLTDEGSTILMDRIHKTFQKNHVEGKEGGRIQELWSRDIVSRNPSAHCDITVQLSVTADGRPDKIHIQLDLIHGVIETDTALLEVFEQNVGDLVFGELRFPPLTTPVEEDNQLFFQYSLVGRE